MPSNRETPIVRAAPALRFLRPWLSKAQMYFFTMNLVGEEGGYYADKAVELRALIESVPALYHYEDSGEPAMARLHYFRGGTDFYLAETEGASGASYGFGVLGGDYLNAELGYSRAIDLASVGLELDFHYKPEPLADIVARYKELRMRP